jgi:hypothetical protein
LSLSQKKPHALSCSTREREPLGWAATQNNLGFVLLRLGERESGTASLEEAVIAFRAALEERIREHVPLECLDEVREWQNRPLDAVYPVVFFDALRVKIRDESVVKNKAVYLALALDCEGPRNQSVRRVGSSF